MVAARCQKLDAWKYKRIARLLRERRPVLSIAKDVGCARKTVQRLAECLNN